MDEELFNVSARLPGPLHQWLADEAKKQHRSLAGQMRITLERAKENAPTAGTVEAS